MEYRQKIVERYMVSLPVSLYVNGRSVRKRKILLLPIYIKGVNDTGYW